MSVISRARHGIATLLCMSAVGAGCVLLGACHKPAGSADAPAAAKLDAEHDAAENSAEGVSLKPEDVEKMGIGVTAALATGHVPEATGFAVVTPHESIAQAVAALATAAAVERNSRAALARVQRLAGTPGAMPADAHDSAERESAVNQAALLLEKRRLTAAFGQKPPWKDDVNSPLLSALAAGETKLVRVTFPLGSLNDETPTSLRLAHINTANPGKAWSSTVIWAAPADATVPGRSFFALLKGSDVGEGERLLVWAPSGASESGVHIPAAAAVISEGKYWCYVERKPQVFVRTALDTGTPVADGYFVKIGIAPGDKVVTSGAGLLLARETNPGSAAE